MGIGPTNATLRRPAYRFVFVGSAMAAMLLAVTACAGSLPTATPAPSPVPATQAPAGPTATPDPFLVEWEALKEAARREGELIIDAEESGRLALENVAEVFGKEYGIKLNVGAREDVAERLVAEQKAGKFLVDLALVSVRDAVRQLIPAGVLDPVEQHLIHPEVLDKNLWLNNRWWWSDGEEKYLFNFAGEANLSPIGDLYINTKIVDPSKIKNASAFNYWDLLDPEQPWAGKIVSEPPERLLSRWGRVLLIDKLGEPWIRAVITQPDITWIANEQRLIVDGMAGGKFALSIMTSGSTQRDMMELGEKGLPLDRLLNHVTLDQTRTIGGGGGGGNISVVKNAPHPNAMKLFLNWFLTKEGQTRRHELQGGPEQDVLTALRTDVTVQGRVPKENLIQPGVDYVVTFGSESIENEVERGRKLAQDIWKCVQLQGAANCK